MSYGNIQTSRKRSPRGRSAFVIAARTAIAKVCKADRWDLGGDEGCITIKHRAITAEIEARECAGMIAQVWIARPEDGRWRCTFEIAGKQDKEVDRQNLARSLRSHLKLHGFPKCVCLSNRSTVVRCRLSVPCIRDDVDDTEANAELCVGEISKIVTFFCFLDSALEDWSA